VIKQREKMTGRALPYAVLLTRTNPAIRTRTMAHIQKGLIDAGIPVMQSELHDREAYRAVFSFRQTLKGLDAHEVANLDKAQANVEEYAMEIIQGLAAAGQSTKKGRAVA
jgi:chromosome partitioning protein